MKIRIVKLLLIALIVRVGYYKYHRWQQGESIRATLEYGRLAPLPAAATDVQVNTEGSIFSRTFWLCFKADKAVIDQWVAQSASLSKQPSAVLPTADFSTGNRPNWFHPQAIRQGLRLDTPLNEKALHGTVWVDYANGIVYVMTSHS